MKKTLTYLIIGLTVWNCAETTPKPENLIPEDKMIDILYDMNMFQAIRNNDYRLYELHNINPEQYIYKKYSIDSIQFVQSNKFYASDMEKYSNLLNAVMDRVTAEKEKIQDSLPERNLKIDSEKFPKKPAIRTLQAENK